MFSLQDYIHFGFLAAILLQLIMVNRHLYNLENLEVVLGEEPDPKYLLPDNGKGPSSRS